MDAAAASERHLFSSDVGDAVRTCWLIGFLFDCLAVAVAVAANMYVFRRTFDFALFWFRFFKAIRCNIFSLCSDDRCVLAARFRMGAFYLCLNGDVYEYLCCCCFCFACEKQQQSGNERKGISGDRSRLRSSGSLSNKCSNAWNVFSISSIAVQAVANVCFPSLSDCSWPLWPPQLLPVRMNTLISISLLCSVQLVRSALPQQVDGLRC